MEKVPEQIQAYYDQLESITKFDRWELMKQLKPISEMFDFKWNNLLNAENICLRFMLHEGYNTPRFLDHWLRCKFYNFTSEYEKYQKKIFSGV